MFSPSRTCKIFRNSSSSRSSTILRYLTSTISSPSGSPSFRHSSAFTLSNLFDHYQKRTFNSILSTSSHSQEVQVEPKTKMKRASTGSNAANGSAASGNGGSQHSASPAAKKAKVSETGLAGSLPETLSIHVFTRDLRVEDNHALSAAVKKGNGAVIPIFVFTPEQTKESSFFSAHSFAFLLAALKDLQKSTADSKPLLFFYGKHSDVLPAITNEIAKATSGTKRVCVSMAEDYTPYAKGRENRTKETCSTYRPSTGSVQMDFLLTEDHNVTKGGLHHLRSGTGTKYRVFTPFYNAAKKLDVHPPIQGNALKQATSSNFNDALAALSARLSRLPCAFSLEQAEKELLVLPKQLSDSYSPQQLVSVYSSPDAKPFTAATSANALLKSGTDVPKIGVLPALRSVALQRLRQYKFDDYPGNRDRASEPCTLLSPHFKFGLVSAREAFAEIKKRRDIKEACKESFLRQMYWRDFYQYVTLHHPWVLAGMRNTSINSGTGGTGATTTGPGGKKLENQNFTMDYTVDDIEWKTDAAALQRWKTGTTGVPLVDAGMREMMQTGFMHNRSRMVVAMFLTKNLLQDWRIGERFFAQNLVDYDPMSNNGGWQWSSSTGADGSPYFRIMNAQSQLAKVDPLLTYVRKFVPELDAVADRKDVLKWEEKKIHEKYTKGSGSSAGSSGAKQGPSVAKKMEPKTIDLTQLVGKKMNTVAPTTTSSGTDSVALANGSSSSSVPTSANGITKTGFKYCAPMVDLKSTREAAIAAFKKAGSKKAQAS
ncbi:unnamed protein product [Amoebophrya sp. A25]|nr:unnamed protein product [Amoebophrya sp. A25]|eukprot:GSA25T00021993001.1